MVPCMTHTYIFNSQHDLCVQECAELDVPVVVIWWEATIAVVTNRSRY